MVKVTSAPLVHDAPSKQQHLFLKFDKLILVHSSVASFIPVNLDVLAQRFHLRFIQFHLACRRARVIASLKLTALCHTAPAVGADVPNELRGGE
jgi:hypothetical protein